MNNFTREFLLGYFFFFNTFSQKSSSGINVF